MRGLNDAPKEQVPTVNEESLQGQVAKDELSQFQQLSLDVANSDRLASIIAYEMSESNMIRIEEGLSRFESISNQMKDDLYATVLYQSLRKQGFPRWIIDLDEKRKLLHGEYILEVPAGSDFDENFPSEYLLAFAGEFIPAPSCEEGEPFALHAIAKKIAMDELPDYKVTFHPLSNGWRVEIDSHETENFRVFVTLKCAVSN